MSMRFVQAALVAGIVVGIEATASASPVVVVTYDSDHVNVGFAGETAPRLVVPALIAKCPTTVGSTATCTGDEARAFQQKGGMASPMVAHGLITDVGAFRVLLGAALVKLGASGSNEAGMMISQPPLAPAASTQSLYAMMLHDLGEPQAYVATDAVLALYASGRTTGIVAEVTSDTSFLVPIYEGYALPHSIMRVDLGKDDTTRYLMGALQKKGVSIDWQRDRDSLWNAETQLGYLALDYDAEMAKPVSSVTATYRLSAGTGAQTLLLNSWTLGQERFMSNEILLKPSMIGQAQAGLHQSIYDSVMKCDVDVRKDLYANVVLAGSGTMVTGIAERLTKELKALTPANTVINVVAPPAREQSAWIGGSILANLSTFKQLWQTRAAFDAGQPPPAGTAY